MKNLFAILATLSVAFSVSAQGPVRRVNTIAELQAIDPAAVAVGDVLAYEVAGYTSSNIWAQPRMADWDKTSVLAQDDVYIFTTAGSGRWIFRDRGLGYTDVSWANALPQAGFDNSDAFERALAITNNIMLSVGRYELSRPIVINNQYPVNWRSTLGSYQCGWQSASSVTEAELVYTGPATNIFVNFLVGMDGTGTNQMIRCGHVMENISFDANGLAETALAAGHLGRATMSRVRYNGATGTNLYLGQIQFLEMRSCSTSRNDERPEGTIPRVGVAIAKDGSGSGAFSAASTLIDCIFESSTEWALVLGPQTKNITIIGGAVESNYGNGVALLEDSTGNILQNVWFENNAGPTNLWIKNTAYFNTFINLRMNEDYAATSHVDSAYNTFVGVSFRNLALHYNGVRNKFINSSYYDTFTDETAGGNTFMDMINAAATIRTNTFSSPYVMYGEPFTLWNGTNLYPRAELKYNGIYFGDGSNPPEVGWTRFSSASLATTNSLLFLPQGVNNTLFTAYTPGDAEPRVRWNVNGTLAWGLGSTNPTDIQFTHPVANELRLDGQLLVLRTNTTHLGFAAGMTNDTSLRIGMTAGGELSFGSGAAARDAFIERTNVGLIQIRTNLVIPGYLTVNGTNFQNAFARSNHTGSLSYTNITGLGTFATFNDAPTNGSPHGRQDGAWVVVPATNHTHDASDTVSGQFESARLGSGTSETDTFLRGGDTPVWDQLSEDDIPNLPTSKITSGTFAAERLGTGTATTNTFLQGNGTNAPFWSTIPSVPSPTNGIADAPADGILYGRKNNSWTQPDISDLSGVSSFGLAWIDGTVADSVDALDALDLIGAGVATIDSPAKYAVRVGSGGTVSTRHRLNLIADTGLTLAISDDAINDEADVTVGIADRDWGDITSTSSGSVWDIDAGAVGEAEIADGAVAYDKIQNVTASRLLGRAPGSDGPPVEVEVGEGLGWDGAKIVNTASGDTIPFAIAAFTHVSDIDNDGEAQTLDATNSAGVSAVWMSAAGIFRITLTSTQPTSPYKRVAVGTISPSEEVFSASVMDQPPDYDSTGTTIYVFIQGGVFEGQQIMLRLYSY